jgi:hypothetical protein
MFSIPKFNSEFQMIVVSERILQLHLFLCNSLLFSTDDACLETLYLA